MLNNPLANTDPTGRDSACNVFNGTYEGSGSGFPCGPGVGSGPSELSWAYEQYANNQSATFYGNLATSYVQQGNVAAAQQVAAVSEGQITVSVDEQKTTTLKDDNGTVLSTQTFNKVTVSQAAAVVAGTTACIVAEPCGVGELLVGTAIIGAAISEALIPDSVTIASHTKGARQSTQQKHEKGEVRKARDRGGEKGDEQRGTVPRRRPPGYKGPWPPRGYRTY